MIMIMYIKPKVLRETEIPMGKQANKSYRMYFENVKMQKLFCER